MLRKSFGTISKLFLTIRTKIGQFFVHIKQMKKMYKNLEELFMNSLKKGPNTLL